MWRHDEAIGTVIKNTADGYTVVKWDGIMGEWHYTEEQTKTIEVISD
tara:strand:+ start:328 stop:468 length:141 start_codon:yes stop_codon:yes gene_type:complete